MILMIGLAGGTAEPNLTSNGAFGMIIVDPLQLNLTAVMPNVRGCPVQVANYPLSIH
jgi:hypothetical protein